MSRYFFYPVLLNMIANTILYVPSILFANRFNGTVPSLVISMIVGSTLAVLCSNALSQFPGKGLPEILSHYLPGWVKNPLLLFLGFMWFSAGSVVLITYARVIQRFLNPDFNLISLLIFLAAVCSWVASRSSKSVLFMVEVMLVLNIPLMLFILFKAISNENMDWDAVLVMRHYWRTAPNWSTLSAASYIFSGYINWVIFNRQFQVKRNSKLLWFIPVVGSIILFTTYTIPIGYHGTIGIVDYVYPWISTADSMRIEFGLVERILYIFLLLNLNFALLYTTTVWHVGSEVIKGAMPKRGLPRKPIQEGIIHWGILVFFFGLTLLLTYIFNEKEYLQLANLWFQIRFPTEIALVLFIVFLARKERRA